MFPAVKISRMEVLFMMMRLSYLRYFKEILQISFFHEILSENDQIMMKVILIDTLESSEHLEQ